MANSNNLPMDPKTKSFSNGSSKFFVDDIFVESFAVRLRFKLPIKFHFYHGSKLYGFISNLVGFHLSPTQKQKVNDIVIYPAETGRINYKAGDEYNFQITFLNNNQKLIENFIKNITNIPDFEVGGDLNKDSVELVSLTRISNLKDYEPLVGDEFTLRFITPLRMERKEEDRQKGGRLFDPENFDGKQFFKLLYKRSADLYKLNFNEFPSSEIPENPEVEILDKYFIWVDSPKDEDKFTLGGIVGYIKFNAELNELWRRILWFGQVMHVGKSSSIGFGKYFIEGTGFKEKITKPAKSFFEAILEKENLLKAFDHLKSNSDFPGIDGINPEFFQKNLDENLNSLIDEAKSGKYNPSELLGIIIPKTESKIRALAIPSLKDRILQRSTVQILSEPIDFLFEENSYAYRRGLSRQGAAYAINEARKNGYNFVLEADIQAFFDNVNWEILFKKIEIILGDDPIVKLIKDWITSDVVFNGIRLKREKGLPQGAVISPLLANLYLDQFDEDLQNDFKLIRYADDFIILCKTKEQAEKALEEVKNALKDLQLELNPTKTRITSFDEGFQYLGYLFINSLVIEKKKNETVNEEIENIKFNVQNLPKSGWLTLVDFEKVKLLNKSEIQEVAPLTNNEVQEILLEKFPLYVTNGAYIHLNDDDIEIVYEEDINETKTKYPLKDLSSIILIGHNKISLPAILKLNELDIPVYFCKPTGELKLAIPLNKPDYNLWYNQTILANDPNFTFQIAREIVRAKINNHKVIARRIVDSDDVKDFFNSLLRKTNSVESIEALRGLEGASAAHFFEILNNSLPSEWRFQKREKRPPSNPLNAMLSFGYSILYHHISTAIQIEGLNPQIGFFHSPSNRYFPLASDIQEEFRHIVDSLVHYIIKRNMVSFNDFTFNESTPYPCLMTNEFRKKFISLIEERLKVEFSPQGFSRKISYRHFITFQVKSLKNSILNKKLRYKPLWIR